MWIWMWNDDGLDNDDDDDDAFDNDDALDNDDEDALDNDDDANNPFDDSEQQALAPAINNNANVAAAELGVKQMGGCVEKQYNQDIKTQKDQHGHVIDFYLFITILSFGEFEQENTVAGFYLMFIAILSFIVSKTASNKYYKWN